MLEEEIQNAIKELSESGDTDLCENLIRDQGVQSPAIAQAAFEAGIFYPPILYQDASPEIRDKLIGLLEQENGETLEKLHANDYLIALAMIGDDTVANYFKKWEEHPKPWRKSLYAGPLEYASEGGWCIEDGQKKSLFYNACYALEKSENAAPENNLFGGTAPQKCPYCDSSYVNMLVIDGRDERLSFLGINGKIKITYCPGCLPWTDSIFCRYTEDGESTVISHKGGGGEPCDDEDLLYQPSFILSKKMVPKSYCEEFERCAIGGRPAFVDDANYITCPECGRLMMHLAQLGTDFTDCGTHYIQICRDCKIATATYQQT